MAASIAVDDTTLQPRLDKARHIKYWTRCLKTLLPHQYTGNDSNRMYLGFFMIAALDLLDALDTVSSEDERQGYVEWIYRCQHPHGGFRMWPGTDFGDRASEENAKWDPANIPATYFALSMLLILGDDLQRVRRKETLQWLRLMQRPTGSFGETLVDGKVEGGLDPRFGYCATGIRYILRDSRAEHVSIAGEGTDDINVDALVQCILQAESFDGGISDYPFHEPHAGYTFCSLGCLNFINRLNTSISGTSDQTTVLGPSDALATVRWLVHRQTDLLDPDALLDSEFQLPNGPTVPLAPMTSENTKITDPAQPVHQSPSKSLPPLFPSESSNAAFAGMNGRMNKVADTCYCWWSAASLHLLEQPGLYDSDALKKYLLQKTQHPVLGGFGKFPGDLPDLYHSYMGLATVSLVGCTDLVEVNPGMCISQRASERLKDLWQGWDERK